MLYLLLPAILYSVLVNESNMILSSITNEICMMWDVYASERTIGFPFRSIDFNPNIDLSQAWWVTLVWFTVELNLHLYIHCLVFWKMTGILTLNSANSIMTDIANALCCSITKCKFRVLQNLTHYLQLLHTLKDDVELSRRRLKADIIRKTTPTHCPLH